MFLFYHVQTDSVTVKLGRLFPLSTAEHLPVIVHVVAESLAAFGAPILLHFQIHELILDQGTISVQARNFTRVQLSCGARFFQRALFHIESQFVLLILYQIGEVLHALDD